MWVKVLNFLDAELHLAVEAAAHLFMTKSVTDPKLPIIGVDVSREKLAVIKAILSWISSLLKRSVNKDTFSSSEVDWPCY